MRAKYINEFERGVDPKEALGIGRVARIQKCFNDFGIHDSFYEILPDVVIFKTYLYLVNKTITWLPDNIKAIGSVDLNGAIIKELPEGLAVGGNYLDLSNAQVNKLPKRLTIISGSLYLGNTQITELPDDLQLNEFVFVKSHQKQLIKNIKSSRFKDKLKYFL